MSQKVVLGVFAHPDDESFGPGGTLAVLAEDHDVHLLFVSKGESGEVEGAKEPQDRAAIRQREAKAASKILGIKSIRFLDFHDGLLCNNHYHQMAEQVEEYIKALKPGIIITFEPRGFTGHLDHVLVSNVMTYLFQRNKVIKKLMYFCIDEVQRAAIPEYYIAFPPGYKEREIGESVDVTSVWDKKIAAIEMHASQAHDKEFFEPMLDLSEKKEHFQILERA